MPITYEIELPSREGFDRVGTDYQYPITSVRGPAQPGQSTPDRFLDLHMMNGIRDIGNMDFKLYMIFVLHRPVTLDQKLTIEGKKEYIKNNKRFDGTTDDQGFYRIKGEGLDTLPESYSIVIHLRNKKNNKDFFEVLVTSGNRGIFAAAQMDVKVESRSDLYHHLVYSRSNTPRGFRSVINSRFIDEVATVYHHMSQVVEFYDKSLNLYEEFDIPNIRVFCYDQSTGGAFYSPPGEIGIRSTNMRTDSPNAPLNREWHEYNHHVQFHMYGGKWPGTPAEFSINHGGFINDSTADSYVEGFAEFMALVTADYYDLGNGPIYAEIANFDIYYKPWHWKGQAEELAVGSLLWKLYDGIYGKEIGVKMDDIWNILKVFSNNFGEVYEKFVEKFPQRKGTIDSLFINHGFFRISQRGNEEYDPLEPFHDQNNDRRYTPSERFIDLPINEEKDRIEIRYEPGAAVGYAAEAGRPDRKSPLVPDGHFIRTNGNAPYYKVTITFENHPNWNYTLNTYNIDGLIKVAVPPHDYASTIKIEPLGVAHETPLTFRTEDFYKNIEENIARGYFAEHDFKETEWVERAVIPTNVIDESTTMPLIGVDENGNIDDFSLVVEEAEIEEVQETITPVEEVPPQKKGGSSIIVILLIVLGGAVFAYLKFLKK